MKNKKIISEIDSDTSNELPLFMGKWLVFWGILICLTTLHVWAAEAPDTENKDTEVVQEAEQTEDASPENTEDKSSTTLEKQGDEADKEKVEITKEVITGTSDRMERYEKDGITILIGNAKTKRHSEEGVEIGFLNADTITIKTNPETGETTEIIAVGNVEIRDDKIFATCDHATMDNLTSIITLKDNVVVLQKNDRLETKLFTFNRTTGKQTGVGDVKFKVTVTQATPTSSEEPEETDSDETDSSEVPDTSKEKEDSSDKEKEDKEKPETDSDKTDSEENATPKESEKENEESESKEDSDNENTETEGSEQSETEEEEETESENTVEEETED